MSIIREYFPGANTPQGFYSYYDFILREREAERRVILKGGPGTGKSTFMKNVARSLLARGYDIELLHCSSDPHSLDGVCAREIGFLIADGTAPHVIEPKSPGAVDEIINLGECWDSGKIRSERAQITETSASISSHFSRAHSYLSAAKALQIQLERDLLALTDMSVAREAAESVRRELGLGRSASKQGSERKAFMSAITPQGRICYADTFAQAARYIYKIEAKMADANTFMTQAAAMLRNSGYDVCTFYCSMSPNEKLEHIYVPTLDVFFSVANSYHSIEEEETAVHINLDDGVDGKRLLALTADDRELYNILLKKAEDAVSAAKQLHDRLEECYVPYMDFGKVENECERLISTIK